MNRRLLTLSTLKLNFVEKPHWWTQIDLNTIVSQNVVAFLFSKHYLCQVGRSKQFDTFDKSFLKLQVSRALFIANTKCFANHSRVNKICRNDESGKMFAKNVSNDKQRTRNLVCSYVKCTISIQGVFWSPSAIVYNHYTNCAFCQKIGLFNFEIRFLL